MLRLTRLLPVLAALLLGLMATAAWAQTPGQEQAARESASRTLAGLVVQVQQLARTSAQSADDAELAEDRTRALALQAQADAVASDLAPRLQTLDGFLAQLGPPPAADAPPEASNLRQIRAAMTKARAATDGLIKQGKLLSTLAGQTAERIAERRRTLFNQRLLTRGSSPFGPEMWSDIASNLPRDLDRLRALTWKAETTALRNAGPRAFGLIGGALLLALTLIGPLRLWLEGVGRRRATVETPASRLRRSGLAIWILLVGSATPALAALALHLGLSWSGVLSGEAREAADAGAGVMVWIAFVTALGRAFLSPKRPSWRLPRLSDEMAERLTPYRWLVAVVTAGGALLERLNGIVGASLAATVASNCAISLAYAATAGVGVMVIGRSRIHELKDAEHEANPVRSLIAVAVVGGVGTAFVAALLGYYALAYLVARQILWIGILAAVLYLLLHLVDDGFTAVFSPSGRLGRQLRAALGLRPSTVAQLGELGSALTRVFLLLAAVGLVLAPFGAGAGEVVGRFGAVATGFKLGGLTVSPLGLLGGVASFALGVWAVRAVQRWLNDRYLPQTEWDTGVRASVSTAVGYLGMILAAVWALASMGLGLQRIALVASALSVGIGFGLQAIVSNFISGLILLVERPVKVGDWVAVGDLEGDVKRINVRATEIAMFDRSTLIVPNSEFVTKTVRNVTHGDSLGRVTLRLSLALDSDAERARATILEAIGDHDDVLRDPPPVVFLDAVTETAVVLQSFCYVASPRASYPTRSALYFDILKRLRAAGINLAQARTEVRVNMTSPPLQSGGGGPERSDGPEGASPHRDFPPPRVA